MVPGISFIFVSFTFIGMATVNYTLCKIIGPQRPSFYTQRKNTGAWILFIPFVTSHDFEDNYFAGNVINISRKDLFDCVSV